MNLHFLDWSIVLLMLSVILAGVFISRRHMTSVADFLSANRTAGRYLVSLSSGVAHLGAIPIIASFELYYTPGFVINWWNMTQHFFLILVAVSGWVIYRFRETRAMTLAQFFEIRYSRKLRVFTGFVAFLAGLINFGIFPGVGARFFMYFLGLPKYYSLLGIQVSTFVTLMFILLAVSIYFVFAGGQIAVLVTDFIQGIFISVIFVVITLFFFNMFDYNTISEAMKMAPENESLINPFNTGNVKDFNFWYYLLNVVGLIFGQLTWQGASGVASSAANAHEQKMGNVLSYWRLMPQVAFLVIIPICAYTVMHHPDFSSQAGNVNNILGALDTPMEKSQLRVPIVLLQFLPIGLIGAFVAVMLAAFISTHDTYLHSWATIFIQDVYLPFTKKKLNPQQHIRLLRKAIISVACFIFIFSFFFQQSQFILLFFTITASIFIAGAGPVVVFGLYWKRGTTAGAWGSMITGALVSITGIIVRQKNPNFFINEMWFSFIANMSAAFVYAMISIFGKRTIYNLDKLLHRGKYDLKGDHKIVVTQQSKGWSILAVTKEFTIGDKIIYLGTYLWIFAWLFVFVIGTIYYFVNGISDTGWMKFWYIYLIIYVIISIVVIIWFFIGGVRDLKYMFAKLGTMVKDDKDDGSVVHEQDDILVSNE